MRAVRAAITYFACVFGAGFLLGSIRVPFLVPRLGVRAAELIEMPFMLLVVLLSARFIVKRFGLLAERRACLAAGSIALALLVSAELMLAFAWQHVTVAQFLASRDPVSGSVYLAMLVLFGLMPSILSRIDALKSLILDH
jgi:hypothetical protein